MHTDEMIDTMFNWLYFIDLLKCANFPFKKRKENDLKINMFLIFSPNAFPPPNRVAPQSDPTKVAGVTKKAKKLRVIRVKL